MSSDFESDFVIQLKLIIFGISFGIESPEKLNMERQ